MMQARNSNNQAPKTMNLLRASSSFRGKAVSMCNRFPVGRSALNSSLNAPQRRGKFATQHAVAQNSRMAKPAGEIAAQSVAETAYYEQPLSERMRTFLRLEFLYQQILYNSESDADWATRARAPGGSFICP